MADAQSPVRAQTPDGKIHEFPAGTPPDVVTRAIKSYISQNPQPQQQPAAQPSTAPETISAFRPSLLERAKRIVAPNYTEASGRYGEHFNPEAALTPSEQAAHPIASGIAQGTGDLARGLTAPANAPYVLGGLMASAIPGGQAVTAPLFRLMLLKGVADVSQGAYEAHAKGDKQQAAAYATEAVGQAFLASTSLPNRGGRPALGQTRAEALGQILPEAEPFKTDSGSTVAPQTPEQPISKTITVQAKPVDETVTPPPVGAQAAPPTMEDPLVKDALRPDLAKARWEQEQQQLKEAARGEVYAATDRFGQPVGGPEAVSGMVPAPEDVPLSRPMGPQATQLKPGQVMPRQLGRTYRSQMPPITPAEAPAEPVAPPAQEAKPSAPPSTEKVLANLESVFNKVDETKEQLAQEDLSDIEREGLQGQLNMRNAAANKQLNQWAAALGGKAPMVADDLRQMLSGRAEAGKPYSGLNDKINYLLKNIENFDKIAAVEKTAAKMKSAGQEDPGAVKGTREALHATEIPAGVSPLMPEGGKKVLPGISQAERENLGASLGQRRATVADPIYMRQVTAAMQQGLPLPVPIDDTPAFKARRAQLENLQQAHREYLRQVTGRKELTPEEVANAIGNIEPAGFLALVGDELTKENRALLEHENANVSAVLRHVQIEAGRLAFKSHGKPMLSAVAAAKNVPTESLKDTGTGKAVSIYHGGDLPVMTQKIWEDFYGGSKGDRITGNYKAKRLLSEAEFARRTEKLKAKVLDERVNKLKELQLRAKRLATFADLIEKRAGEVGASGTAITGGVAAGGVVGAAVGTALGGPVGGFVGAGVGMVAGATGVAFSPVNLADELAKLRAKLGVTRDQTIEALRGLFGSRSSIARVSDAMDHWKGEIDRRDYIAAQVMDRYNAWANTLTHDEVRRIVDARKTSQLMLTSQEERDFDQLAGELSDSQYVEMQRVLLDAAQQRGHDYFPTEYQDLYHRVMWKDPDAAAKVFGVGRSLYGDRGMLKQHVFDTMSEGLQAGLEPRTWNIVEQVLAAAHSTNTFVNGMDLAHYLIGIDRLGVPGAKFLKTGQKMPPGYMRTVGTNMQVFFHVPEGLVKAGEWVVDKEYGRMLNTYMSPDYVRKYAPARAVIGFKHVLGMWRLFGVFHPFAMAWGAYATEAGLGAREAAMGLEKGDFGTLFKGLADIAKSPVAGYQDFQLGRIAQRYMIASATNPIGPSFVDSPVGRAFAAQFGHNSTELLALLWDGGARNMFHVQRDSTAAAALAVNRHVREFLEAAKTDRPLATAGYGIVALGTALPSTIQGIMRPIFETYIPALKLGIALRDLDISLSTHAPDILAGKLSKGQLAHDVVMRTEEFFGELNRDNLWMSRSIGSALQFLYRSYTWKGGTARSAILAAGGQVKELVATPIKGREGYYGTGSKSRIPRMDPRFATWASYIIGTAVMSSLATKAFTKKWPWEWAKDFIEYVAPRSGGLNAQGKPNRMFWPNYVRELWMASRHPFGPPTNNSIVDWATSGFSDILQNLKEAHQNKKFDGSYIVKPTEHNEYLSWLLQYSHILSPAGGELSDIKDQPPGSFGYQNWTRWREKGYSKEKATGLTFGLGAGPTPLSAELSPAERELQRFQSVNYGAGSAMTDEQVKARNLENQITLEYRNKGDYRSLIRQGIQQGILTERNIDRAIERGTRSYLQNGIANPQISLEESLLVYERATPAEQKSIKPLIANKLDSIGNNPNPQERKRLLTMYRDVMRGVKR